MITSIKVKVFISNTFFVFISFVNRLMKHNNNKILFYINLEFRDNTKVLYEYLIDNRYNEKYKIVCACIDYKKYRDKEPKNVSFVSRYRAIIDFLSAGKIIYSIGHLPIKAAKDQDIIQMWHGAPMKDVDKGTLATHPTGHGYYTKVLSTSEHFAQFWARHFNVKRDTIFVCGYPRNEILFNNTTKYDFGDYKKLILWAPTFRKSSQIGVSDSDSNSLIPILDKDDFVAFDNYLTSIGVKVIVKLHPIQDLSNYSLIEMNNLILLSHREFLQKGMDLYKLMTQCDALITDYSSIFYDFLLLDRPIGFTVDDVDSFTENRGFWMKNPDLYKPGMKVKSISDLMEFCRNVAENIDNYKDERKRVNTLANDYTDGHYCDRILKEMKITKD